MRDTRFVRLGIRALGGVLLLAALLLPAAAGRSAAALLAQPAGGYWQYAETINNSEDQSVDPVYTAVQWSPQFGENSESGIYTYHEVTTTGSCNWTYESPGGIDTLVEGKVVTVRLSAEYTGIDPNKLGNQLYAYACFNEAGVMGADVTQGAVCTDMLTVPGPGGSGSQDLPITIPAGPLFPSGRAALEVKCCPNCYKSLSVQRVYQWVEGAVPAGASPCEQVALSYSPNPPVAGTELLLTAQASPASAGYDAWSGTWSINGHDQFGGSIAEWDGCAVTAWYSYTCNGQQYSKTLAVPGKPCKSGVGWRVAVGVLGLAAAFAAAAATLLRRRRTDPNTEEYILHLSSDREEITAGGWNTSVTATVYQVGAQPTPAPRAPLRVSVAPGLPGLVAGPKAGKSALTFKIAATPDCPGGTGWVNVQGQVRRSVYTARVQVDVKLPYRLEVKSRDPKNVVPLPPGELWAYARVVTDEARESAQAAAKELTGKIDFRLQGENAAAVQPSGKQPTKDGWRAVRLTQVPDKASGVGGPALVAFVMSGSKQLAASLSLSLQARYAVEFREQRLVEEPGRGLDVADKSLLVSQDHPGEFATTVYAVALDLAPELARPPRPAEPDGAMSQQIVFAKRGPNQEYVEIESAGPYGRPTEAAGGGQVAQARAARVRWTPPQKGQSMQDDDPEAVAQLPVGSKKVESAIRLDLTECRLALLQSDLEDIAQRLKDEGYYVRNPYLGGSTGPIADKANQIYGVAWDWSVGLPFGYKGARCEDYVRMTQHEVTVAVRRAFGSRARLTTAVVKEKSSIADWSPSFGSVVDTLDWMYEINHILFHVTLPDHREYGIDFWEYFRGKEPSWPLMAPYSRYQQLWLERLKGDIDEGVPAADQDTFYSGKVPRFDAPKRQAGGIEE